MKKVMREVEFYQCEKCENIYSCRYDVDKCELRHTCTHDFDIEVTADDEDDPDYLSLTRKCRKCGVTAERGSIYLSQPNLELLWVYFKLGKPSEGEK